MFSYPHCGHRERYDGGSHQHVGPVGDDEFTSDRFDPNVRLSFVHTLSDRVSLGYNVGIGVESGLGDDLRRHTLSTAFYTVAVGLSLTDKLGAFVELFGREDVTLVG